MGIIGISFSSISASVSEEKTENANISVNSSPRITDVKEKPVGIPGLEKALYIDFVFSTVYDPDVGKITLKGEVIYVSDSSKEIIEKWQKEKMFDDSLAVEILNAIFRRSLSKALDLAQELRLPPPIQFPKVRMKNETDNKENNI